MGLTSSSTGLGAVDSGLGIRKRSEDDRVIAIAGNPNVGKSTLFNNLTGMNQHTGNWPGKTVSNATGYCGRYVMVDIPGTYSLLAHSAEEEVARNFICFEKPDATVVVCDATCLERNLNLVLQTIEISKKTLVCVNLLDEAKRKNISVDLKLLSKRLGVDVIGMVATKKRSLDVFVRQLDRLTESNVTKTPHRVRYCDDIEYAISLIEPTLKGKTDVYTRWLTLRLLDGDESLCREIEARCPALFTDTKTAEAIKAAKEYLAQKGLLDDTFKDSIVGSIVADAERICKGVIVYSGGKYSDIDRKIDKVVTSKAFGYPIMILLLALVFWLTVSLANYPSEILGKVLFKAEAPLSEFFIKLNAPDWLREIAVEGVYRVLAWVVSVMLPPMAIFFPLFTLLEDFGYLPRIAYNLDKPFMRCGSCGKQALTTCMGLGCNAAGVVGCRIIDSPRERLIAVLTNCFVPCNGRFPTMITLIAVFFVGSRGGTGSVLSALILTAVIILGIIMTFSVSWLLSKTVLRGVPSSVTLELPPYRRPQVIKVITRSVFDRTLYVLGRAAAVAAPAGAVIWIMANVTVSGETLLSVCAQLLDAPGRMLGMDGVILIAFILGFPANEIVLPIAIMAYMSNGTLTDTATIDEIGQILVQNGWTFKTALCTVIFSLMHWPCSTTLLTIKKETASLKWTVAAVLIPTLTGMVLCFIINLLSVLF